MISWPVVVVQGTVINLRKIFHASFLCACVKRDMLHYILFRLGGWLVRNI